MNIRHPLQGVGAMSLMATAAVQPSARSTRWASRRKINQHQQKAREAKSERASSGMSNWRPHGFSALIQKGLRRA